jgi:predicted membrane metal-binding protein
MPIGNIIALGFILSFFGSFVIVLAWGAWWSNRTPSPWRVPTTTRRPQAAGSQELAPVRIRR